MEVSGTSPLPVVSGDVGAVAERHACTSELDRGATLSAFTPAAASRALEEACLAAGQESDGADLIRIGSNAVYRLRGRVIARISRDASSLANARMQVAVARWLASAGYPATRALDIDQPIEADGRVVTFWESVSEGEDYAPIADVAQLIRRLHELRQPETLRLPPADPFAHGQASIDAVDGVPLEDVRFLRDRFSSLQAEYAQLEFALSPGPIHGDANVGNVILDRNGCPVLIDLDSFATGPREWDLVQTALFYERFGWHTDDEYRTFVKVYGFDILDWPGYTVLADSREIMMTAWLGRMAGTNGRAAAEFGKRVEAIRTGASRRDWGPF